MSPGKLAVQVAHGSLAAAERVRQGKQKWYKAWFREKQKKVVVKVSDDSQLHQLYDQARELEVPCELIQDAGLTELPPGTTTVLAIGPASNELVDRLTGDLPLL
jgi:PTH2 family peptidyl-tRNA hydrolase